MPTELPVWAVRLIIVSAAVPPLVYLVHRFATWCARELQTDWQPPTWRSVWAWIGRQHVRVRIRRLNRGRLHVPLTLVHPQSSRIDWPRSPSLHTRAAKGVRWTSKGDRA